MGLRFIVGYEQGSNVGEKAVLYCSTTGYVYGTAFEQTNDGLLDALEVGQAFLKWCEQEGVAGGDIRRLSPGRLGTLQEEFDDVMQEAHGGNQNDTL